MLSLAEVLSTIEVTHCKAAAAEAAAAGDRGGSTCELTKCEGEHVCMAASRAATARTPR